MSKRISGPIEPAPCLCGKDVSVPRSIIWSGFAAWALIQMPETSAANAAGQIAIGVIQYNVKGGQGGWTASHQTRAKQVQLIIDEVKELSDKANPIEFITLEQADPPLLADDLKQAGLPGWTTIGSQCRQFDSKRSPNKVQLSYSAHWELVAKTGLQNPLVDGYATDACWAWGRPYNIAYFHNERTGTDVLFVIVHMPHCRDLTRCFDEWRLEDFFSDVQKVVGLELSDLTKLNVVLSGDMNELGQDGGPLDFGHVFKQFGTLKKSPNLETCCEDNGFSASYDHLATNNGTITNAVVINNGAYPIDPSFNERHPNGEVHNEEHKAIYGIVTFPTP